MKNHKELLNLKGASEDTNKFLKQSPEKLLIRWFNYHLKQAGHAQELTNFTEDLKVKLVM